MQEATFVVVNTLAASLARDEARALLEREHDEWRERDEPRSARALWGLSWVEFWAGRWALAASHAGQAHEISIQYGLEVPQDHLPIALIAVHRGQLELAREHSERALELAERAVRASPSAAPGDPRTRRPVEWRPVRGRPFARSGRRAGRGARVGRAEHPLVERRLRRGAARARPDRRRRSRPRRLGDRRDAARP